MISSKRLPYPGLRAFTREESDLFFGREGCVDAMVDRLASTRFLAVLGASGSGKSSLVRTGLLDALDLGFHPWAGSKWKVVDMHPGGQPMRNLAAALLEATVGSAPNPSDINFLTTFLRQGPRSLVQWTSGGNLQSGWNLLVLVDQFEELFRYGEYAQREAAEAFSSLLLESASTPGAPIHIVITMRSEYLGGSALISGLAEGVSSGLYLTPRMSREQCRQAIEKPARVIGSTVEPALVNRLLNDLTSFAPWEGGEGVDQAERLARRADQLPLMQHVLNRLWARASEDSADAPVELKLDSYESIGGLSGALDAHGQEVMNALGADRAALVQTVFCALVSGTTLASAVRRPCQLRELIAVAGGTREDIVAIVEAFRAPDCNFLRTSQPSLETDDVIVDISHESLIRQWTPLTQWLATETRSAAAWQRLISAEERYAQKEGDLLTGLDLASLTAWWESACPTPAWAARHGGRFEAVTAFLEASRHAEAARAEAEHRRQMRERNRLRRFAVGFGLAFLVAAAGCLIAFKESRQAKQSARGTEIVVEKVNDILLSDRNVSLFGVGPFQRDLLTALRPYQLEVYKRYLAADDLESSIQLVLSEFHLGQTLAGLGEAKAGMDEHHRGYEDGFAAIKRFAPGQDREPLEAALIEDGINYSWSLFDVGMEQDATNVMNNLEKLAGVHSAKPAYLPLQLAYAGLENLQNRYYRDHHQKEKARIHLLKAIDLASSVVSSPDPTMQAMNRQFALYRNAGEEYSDKACDLAKRMVATSPMDSRAISARVDCLEDQGNRATTRHDLDTARQKLASAQDIVNQALKLVPSDQSMLLLMSGIECDLAELNWGGGKESPNPTERIRHQEQARYYFVKALENKTLLPSTTGEVRTLYQKFESGIQESLGLRQTQNPKNAQHDRTRVESISSPSPVEGSEAYRELAGAVSLTRIAFPNAPDFIYVEASAWIKAGEMLQNNPDPKSKKEAEKYLEAGTRLFESTSTLQDTSSFNEDFYTFCSAYGDQVKLHAASGRVDLMQADIKRMKGVCTSALNKYPWDFYLREEFVKNARHAGQALFDLHRYADAVPYIEYASHWGVGESTRLLARMYHEGLGVPPDEQKAKELEELAPKQTMKKFTIPSDFGGVKAPFEFYVLQWPDEYPFQGIDDQARWLKEARGGIVPPEVAEAFRKLHKIARDSKVSFPELCAYALGTADKGAAKEKEHKSTEATSP